jgi:hypothetical protein
MKVNRSAIVMVELSRPFTKSRPMLSICEKMSSRICGHYCRGLYGRAVQIITDQNSKKLAIDKTWFESPDNVDTTING